jgi:hypothetical protein
MHLTRPENIFFSLPFPALRALDLSLVFREKYGLGHSSFPILTRCRAALATSLLRKNGLPLT